MYRGLYNQPPVALLRVKTSSVDGIVFNYTNIMLSTSNVILCREAEHVKLST